MEAEKYETATHQLESEGSNLRLEIMTRDGEFRRLREKIEQLDRKNQEVRYKFYSNDWVWWCFFLSDKNGQVLVPTCHNVLFGWMCMLPVPRFERNFFRIHRLSILAQV